MLPAQIRVGALPGVPQHLAPEAGLKVPPQAHLFHRGLSRGDVNRQRLPLRHGFHPHVVQLEGVPLIGGKRLLFLHHHHVGDSLYILKHIFSLKS